MGYSISTSCMTGPPHFIPGYRLWSIPWGGSTARLITLTAIPGGPPVDSILLLISGVGKYGNVGGLQGSNEFRVGGGNGVFLTRGEDCVVKGVCFYSQGRAAMW